MNIGSFAIEQLAPEYNEPTVPVSLVSVLTAGPIEESLFFGIPFYLFGNNLVVLGGGVVWAMIHILNTSTFDFNNLAYLNWLFVIPSLFFSLRTWISGKGWFSIITHSAWNGLFFGLGCMYGEISCNTIDYQKPFENISAIVISIILISITYSLYKVRNNKESKLPSDLTGRKI